ncbi:MAG: HAD family phosphatase [Sphingobacteriia bacterium]|jgi:FMN phosphatase YigB (HAD superfamily)|nr:MAG: HAD family phosphatase [Sphingobacteriia bacterium]
MQPIKNIIFDLGGVFLNINFQLTNSAFANLGVDRFAEMFNQHHSNDLFEMLEKGEISAPAFYEAFRKESGTNISDDAIRNAWNALLLDFPPERIEWLAQIKKRYNIYLFSNTNQIHYDAFMADFGKTFGGKDFNSYFIKAYYSQTLGLRKPSVASYKAIIQEQGLIPAETLFIDDTIKNIEGAKEAGLQTIHLVAPNTVLDLEL